MADTRRVSSFFLFCAAVLIVSPADSIALTPNPGYGTSPHAQSPGAAGNDEGLEEYPFDNVYYSYKTQANELIKDKKLYPPIAYRTPDGYDLALEPVAHFCKGVNKSIFTKFSVIKSKRPEVFINVDEDLTGILTNDSTIVYKLKAINSINSSTIGGETTVLIRVVQILSVPDTELVFEEPRYSIKLSYGRKGKVFTFKALKTAVNAIEEDTDLEFEKQPESAKHLSKKEYPFSGNYSLEYVPEQLLPILRVNKAGDLEIIGNIIEGNYIFDVVASDFGPNSSTVLNAKAKVNLFVDSVAVCSTNKSNFMKAFSKHYITEETKLQTVIPGTGPNPNCIFAISHQYPLGVGTEFFTIDPQTGSVHVKSAIDREAYPFEEMEEPSVYLKLKIHCPPPAEQPPVKPFNLPDADNIDYDPTSTLVQLLIVDANDNLPVFPEKHITVGYPVSEVVDTILPKHLVQVKATDKDTGKHGKIQYSLRGDNAQDFVVNPETGTIYCTRPVVDRNTKKTFDVVAKDSDSKSEETESVLAVTVKFLTYSNIIRVNVKFSTTEDQTAVELQLSEISGLRVMSLTNDVINTLTADGLWRTERTLTVYGVNNADDSLVSGSDLEKKLSGNEKILRISKYSTESDNETGTGTSVVYAALFCLMLSMVALGLLYFGYVKNGRYLSCISSTSTTPLKDDMENMSQSNWITTFNRSNISSCRVRFPGNVDSSKPVDDTSTVIVENALYESIPPKGKNGSANNSSTVKLDTNLSFEDDLLSLEKMDETLSPTDERTFNY